MSNYSELLKDPRWQKKRLEIMERDDFACQICTDKKSMLTVHHIYYKKHLKPWEYREKAYLTLCDRCHKLEHETIDNWDIDGVLQDFKDVGITVFTIRCLFLQVRSGKINHRSLLRFISGQA